jgi:hypothetical protein
MRQGDALCVTYFWLDQTELQELVGNYGIISRLFGIDNVFGPFFDQMFLKQSGMA